VASQLPLVFASLSTINSLPSWRANTLEATHRVLAFSFAIGSARINSFCGSFVTFVEIFTLAGFLVQSVSKRTFADVMAKYVDTFSSLAQSRKKNTLINVFQDNVDGVQKESRTTRAKGIVLSCVKFRAVFTWISPAFRISSTTASCSCDIFTDRIFAHSRAINVVNAQKAVARSFVNATDSRWVEAESFWTLTNV
jgi:hypothetical protein